MRTVSRHHGNAGMMTTGKANVCRVGLSWTYMATYLCTVNLGRIYTATALQHKSDAPLNAISMDWIYI